MCIYTPFIESERDTGCFRCGYQWPDYCIDKHAVDHAAMAALEAGEITLIESCPSCSDSEDMMAGLVNCKRCGAWRYGGLLPISLR